MVDNVVDLGDLGLFGVVKGMVEGLVIEVVGGEDGGGVGVGEGGFRGVGEEYVE